eukprot:1148734-Pelagomonas_calceolata.AAC.5
MHIHFYFPGMVPCAESSIPCLDAGTYRTLLLGKRGLFFTLPSQQKGYFLHPIIITEGFLLSNNSHIANLRVVTVRLGDLPRMVNQALILANSESDYWILHIRHTPVNLYNTL